MLATAWAHNKKQLISEALKIAHKTSIELGYLNDFNTIIQYIIVTIEFSHKELVSIVENEIPERRRDVLTISEELKEKGKKELADVMAKMRKKFGNESFELIDKLREKNALDQLDKVSTAIDEANNLEELKKMI